MENSQSVYLNNGLGTSQEQGNTDDHVWKALYSHSYTVLFTCENCDHGFDIDGWFYKFETITCPKCRTSYSGLFGRVLPANRLDQSETNKPYLGLETFDGQEFMFQINSAGRLNHTLTDHIILVISSKQPEKQYKVLGIMDFSEPKPKLQVISELSGNGKNTQIPKSEGKPKSFLAMLFGIW